MPSGADEERGPGSAAAGQPPGVRRYWCRPAAAADLVVFDEDETHHLRRVMRRCAGDRLEAIDGSGRVLSVELLPGGGRRARGRVLDARAATPPAAPEVWLGQALIRPARLEWLVEKGVELGMHGLQPLVTRFSAPAGQLGPRRRQRLERIARSAVCQSLGVRLPELRAPRPLEELETAAFDRILLAHGSGAPLAAPPLVPPPAGRRLLLLVGPEGGWAPDELALLEERGARRTSLGGRRLRAETAALAGLALLLCLPSSSGRD